ncbi:MAG: tRNA-2-methylthio-N6-dimethylallyladenosine synthase [Patescibacteria group bacterium]|nr:tRNA-2-methylthio-N6-dimethylallyladenosine synthase [Patescibacteria group bacterium]
MTQKYYLITIGCQMNIADSSRLAAFLEKNNYQKTSNPEQADLIIFNTCGIRQSAENRVYGLVNSIRKKNKKAKIVITGCLSQRSDVQKRLAGLVDIFMPISAMPDMMKLLKNREFKSNLSLDEIRLRQGEKYLAIIPKYASRFSAFVPIGNGCNNFCSYCVVPYARGREVYRPALAIVKEVRELVKKGYKEIILIAQNVNSYKSGSYDFAKLLAQVAKIKGDFWLRFSTSHPKDVSLNLIKVLGEEKKICPHFHLAVQSGDDDILRAMNRGYSAKHFLQLVEKIRAARPGMAITTDIIVGFPGEKRKQFQNTVKLFKAAKFDLAYISRYSPRPMTASYSMPDDVSLEEKKRREKELEKILVQTALSNNQFYKGKTERVLIEGINKAGNYWGRNAAHKVVNIYSQGKANKKVIGSFVAVKINKVTAFNLSGDLL